jgi:hypothetical protein
MYRVIKHALTLFIVSFLLLTECRPDSKRKQWSWLESFRDKRKIFLRSETLDARELARKERVHPGSSTPDSLRDLERSLEDRLFLVHLNDASNSNQRRAVETALGCRLKRYIPHNTFIVRMSSRKVICRHMCAAAMYT